MSEPVRVSTASKIEPESSPYAGFELLKERPVPGIIRRFFTTMRHIMGLALGGFIRSVRKRKANGESGIRFMFTRFMAFWARLFVDGKLVNEPFPIQLRIRLERLGPTYIKLGQILSLREDILPKTITNELKNLLDRLPVVTYERYLELIEADLKQPANLIFASVDPRPLGSASIAQTHRARTHEGDDVILKVVKPGIAEMLKRDSTLLKTLGAFLQIILPQYQPRRVLTEFCEYTLREVDLRREADNAETFSANFKDLPDVVFPKIYRKLSGKNVLCMEFLDGVKPDSDAALHLTDAERDKLLDLGAGSIIRMLYKDGFFHADLHPGNLLVLKDARCGFIDLGMIGRFDDELRRTMMYYYYCLVIGDAENAARYIAAVADPGAGGNPTAFRRAVEDLSRRWHRNANFDDFSLAQLIMESVSLGGQYRMYFPVEMILMVKALVTFEGVGQVLKPGFNVAEVSKRHISRLFMNQFNPLRLMKESFRGAPEIVDAMVKAPLLVTEGLRFLEKSTKKPPENPLAGLRGTLFAGACMVAAAILVAAKGPWPVYSALFAVSIILALRRGES